MLIPCDSRSADGSLKFLTVSRRIRRSVVGLSPSKNWGRRGICIFRPVRVGVPATWQYPWPIVACRFGNDAGPGFWNVHRTPDPVRSGILIRSPWNLGNIENDMKQLLPGVLLLAAALLSLGCSAEEPTVQDMPAAQDTSEAPPEEAQLRILAINDFHGHIATSSDSFGGVGRADFLAANIAAARAEVENSVFVSAGDLIGASPLVSALFHDEPTIEAMNLMGLDINGVGNHEFDEGSAELLRMQQGGTHPADGDLDGDSFGGADFQFVAANVIDDATGETIFPPYVVREYQGIEVAFIGMTLEGTPGIVARSGVADLTFQDEAETVNSLVAQLEEMGIEAIVVLLHEGGFSDGGQNDCGSGLDGPIAEVVGRMDSAVDLVISGHTHDEFVCEVDGRWVTMADNGGRLFTVIDASLNRQTRDLTVMAVNNRPNSQVEVSPVPALTALIDKYDTLSAPKAKAIAGFFTADIVRQQNEAGESSLGEVVADAHLAATPATRWWPS